MYINTLKDTVYGCENLFILSHTSSTTAWSVMLVCPNFIITIIFTLIFMTILHTLNGKLSYYHNPF